MGVAPVSRHETVTPECGFRSIDRRRTGVVLCISVSDSVQERSGKKNSIRSRLYNHLVAPFASLDLPYTALWSVHGVDAHADRRTDAPAIADSRARRTAARPLCNQT